MIGARRTSIVSFGVAIDILWPMKNRVARIVEAAAETVEPPVSAFNARKNQIRRKKFCERQRGGAVPWDTMDEEAQWVLLGAFRWGRR